MKGVFQEYKKEKSIGKTLITYDISDDKCRRMLERCLRGYGKRVQRSVFECLIDKTRKKRNDRKNQKNSDFRGR